MPAKNDRHWLEPPAWWKRWKPLRWLAALGALAVLSSGYWAGQRILAPAAHPEAAAYRALEEGVILLDGLRSYQTLAEVQAHLQAARLEVRHEQSRKPPSDRYPPRDLDTLVVPKYRHLGTEGELELEFFNDRLYQATFTPERAVPYNRALRKLERGLRVGRNGKGELLDGERRVATNVDHAASDVGRAIRSTPYVIWQDLRLVAQRDAWEDAYGAIAVLAE